MHGCVGMVCMYLYIDYVNVHVVTCFVIPRFSFSISSLNARYCITKVQFSSYSCRRTFLLAFAVVYGG